MTAAIATPAESVEEHWHRRSVFERVHAVLSALPAIGKNSTAPGAMGGYAFRGIEDITAALKPLLAEHGVFMVPTVIDRRDDVRTTANNRSLYVADVLVRFRFYGTTPAQLESFDAEVWGQGTDSGDKAVQKAMTSAFKTMLSITFCISDSEYDAERHDVPDTHAGAGVSGEVAPVPAPIDRVNEVRALVETAKAEQWVKDSAFVWPWTEATCTLIEAHALDALGKEPF